jgi:WD40 repeat protein
LTAWSPDGEYLATASEDNTARLWRKDGSPVRDLTGHSEPVRSLAVSPDGKRLATGGNDGVVLVWEQASDQPVGRYGGGGYGVSGMAWSRDGTFLVVANDELRVIQTDNWQEVANLGPGNGATVLTWSPDEMLAVGADDGSLRLFAADGALVADMVGHTDRITGIAWSPNGDRFASAGGNLLLWDAQEGRRLATLEGHTDAVVTVAWSPDGQVIASGANDRTVRLWHMDGGALSTLSGHEDEVNQVAWLRDGTLVSGDNGSILRWWSATGTLLSQEKGAGCGVYHLAPSPADSSIAVAQLCDPVEIWR